MRYHRYIGVIIGLVVVGTIVYFVHPGSIMMPSDKEGDTDGLIIKEDTHGIKTVQSGESGIDGEKKINVEQEAEDGGLENEVITDLEQKENPIDEDGSIGKRLQNKGFTGSVNGIDEIGSGIFHITHFTDCGFYVKDGQLLNQKVKKLLAEDTEEDVYVYFLLMKKEGFSIKIQCEPLDFVYFFGNSKILNSLDQLADVDHLTEITHNNRTRLIFSQFTEGTFGGAYSGAKKLYFINKQSKIGIGVELRTYLGEEYEKAKLEYEKLNKGTSEKIKLQEDWSNLEEWIYKIDFSDPN